MSNLNNFLGNRFGMQHAPASFIFRLGRREALVCRDFRKRCYRVNPVIECSAGIEPGHLEILLLRRWLVILSRGSRRLW